VQPVALEIFASETPVTDGERVYAYFGMHGVYCYDLAGKFQKPIRLICSGFDEVEVSPTVKDTLSLSLLHILRNSIDHGIESPAERSICKKPAIGRIQIEVRIEDAKIKVRALARRSADDVDFIRTRVLWTSCERESSCTSSTRYIRPQQSSAICLVEWCAEEDSTATSCSRAPNHARRTCWVSSAPQPCRPARK